MSGTRLDRYSPHIRAQKMMRESYRAGNPIRLPARARQTPVPVEITSQGLQQHSDVRDPKRPNRAVAQSVEAKETKLVLRSQDSHFKVAQTNQLRARENLIRLTLIEFAEP
jgi:hypothetical protein